MGQALRAQLVDRLTTRCEIFTRTCRWQKECKIFLHEYLISVPVIRCWIDPFTFVTCQQFILKIIASPRIMSTIGTLLLKNSIPVQGFSILTFNVNIWIPCKSEPLQYLVRTRIDEKAQQMVYLHIAKFSLIHRRFHQHSALTSQPEIMPRFIYWL